MKINTKLREKIWFAYICETRDLMRVVYDPTSHIVNKQSSFTYIL